MNLTEQTLAPTEWPLSGKARDFLSEGRSRFSSVDCFDFVPSKYELVWRTLDALPRGRFCEWGSGFGLVTGMAELLGFDAGGIEVDEHLAEASRKLLNDFQLSARIITGSYFELPCDADVVFVYCWFSKTRMTEEYFAAYAPDDAKLLICYGQNDIRCKVKSTKDRSSLNIVR